MERTPGELRVLHALDSMAGGGAQQVVLDLVSWSSSAGVATAIVAADGARAVDIPASVVFLPVSEGSFLSYVRGLMDACRRFRPTVLHAHQRREALACLIVGGLLRIPVVEHAHTVLPDTRLKKLSFRTRRIFSVGPAVTRMLTQTFSVSADRIDTIGNLVPPAALVAPAAPCTRSDDVVLGIGRLEEQKDPLRFADLVAAGDGRFRGVWYGDGPLRDVAVQHAERIGTPAVFAGRTTAVIAEMDRASALLLTSRWEGTPLVVLEAFARGLLVIAFEAPGVTELVADRGILLPADLAPAEGAEAITAALASDTSGLRASARAYADEHADPSSVFAPVLATYRELAAA